MLIFSFCQIAPKFAMGARISEPQNFYDKGFSLGRRLRIPIRSNLRNFWASLETMGFSRSWLLVKLEKENSNEEISGMAAGAEIPSADLLAFNLTRKVFFPDECTMMLALGDSTESGNVLYLKNSDKVGGAQLVGPGFYKFKEINVVRVMEVSGRKVIGVAAAGETGLKMGINENGVLSGSNIARTRELKEKQLNLSRLMGSDRQELVKRGLGFATAADAAGAMSKEMLENPTATPGNLHFVDSSGAYLIEGSYDQIAILHLKAGTAARANGFVLLKALNDPDDTSTQLRYARATRLLEENAGRLTSEMFVKFSQDHKNGPGINSICRHSDDYVDETSLSSAVMEIDRQKPTESRIRIALGKPCHAWSDPRGHTTLRASTKLIEIPDGFNNGEIWKEEYSEIPFHA